MAIKFTSTQVYLQSAEIIFEYFPDLSDTQRNRFIQLYPLYKTWNEKINVISRKDIDNLYINHVLHALGIAKVCSFRPHAHILDIGTGGGFPGLPLAILFPETQFHLVDSIGKKITVVKNVADHLKLQNVKAEQIRGEQLKIEYDFIVSRAVTRLKEFYGWVDDKVKRKSIHEINNGILYLKGGDLEDELNELKKPHQVFDLSLYFKEAFFETKKVVFIPI